MKIFLSVAYISIFAQVVFSQSLRYTVDLTHTDSKEVTVTVTLNGFHSANASYQMPVWAPGAYSVTNYGRFVKNFKALDKTGKEIPATKVNENRWEMSSASDLATISYSVINSYKDSTSLYFAMCHIDTNYFFANGTALFGYVNDKKNVPASVKYVSPRYWKTYTAENTDISEPTAADVGSQMNTKAFAVKNYDELADAPVMAGQDIQFRSFDQDGARYDIAVASDKEFAMDSLAESTKKIVKAETDFFHDTPFKRYTFLINAPTFANAPAFSFGALEHANSSAYLMMNVDWSFFKQIGLSTISHEFFHLWNVKRIHSNKLGPFDYTKRVMTTSLWLSEGVTDYYANCLLSRAGIMKPGYFEAKIAEWYAEAKNSKAATSESLEQLSIDESEFDLNKAISFYSKGPLVAMMLDVEIRTQTGNKKSLDDVMRSLYADAKHNKYFKDEELITKIEKISGAKLQDFYHKYIAGTDSLPLAPYLNKMGLMKDYKKEIHSGVDFETRFTNDSANLIISSFKNMIKMTKNLKSETGRDSSYETYQQVTTAFERAGLQIGDTIVSINGKPMNYELADEFSLNQSAPVTIHIVALQSGKRIEKDITLTSYRSFRIEKRDVAPNKDATAAELAIRNAIYGG